MPERRWLALGSAVTDPFLALRGEPPALQVLKHPLGFVFRVLRGFSTNQGLLLAGAIAYYALLSVVPLLILTVFLLSNLVSQAELLGVLGRYLEWLVPSQSQAVLGDVSRFLQNGIGIGALLLLTMLFFSSLAFSGLEKAMAIIFAHRGRQKKRHFLVSAVLPYCFVFVLGIALLVVTFASASLQAMEHESIHFLGTDWSLRGVSGLLFYLLGLAMETAVLTSLYLIIPVGRTSLSHALIGGFFGRPAVGSSAPCAGLVPDQLVAGQCRLWLADHGGGGAVLHGTRRDAATARRPGDRRVRVAGRQRTRLITWRSARARWAART